MADITKCEGTGCPLRNTCYRFTAPSNDYWQAFFTGIPLERGDTGKATCVMFWLDEQLEWNKRKKK